MKKLSKEEQQEIAANIVAAADIQRNHFTGSLDSLLLAQTKLCNVLYELANITYIKEAVKNLNYPGTDCLELDKYFNYYLTNLHGAYKSIEGAQDALREIRDFCALTLRLRNHNKKEKEEQKEAEHVKME